MIIVQVAGRLGRDPETRFTPSGLKVTSLTVATTVRKGGKEETVWWRVTVWGDRYDKMISYFKKGSAIIAMGEMNKPEIWTDKEGRPQVGLELTADILRFSPFGNPDSNKDKTELGQSNQGSYQQSSSQASSSNFGNDSASTDISGNAPYQSHAASTPYSSNSYGATQYGAGQGQSQGNSTGRFNQAVPHNEDNLPF